MHRVLEVVSNQLNTKLSYNNDTLFQDAKSPYTKLIVSIVIIFAHNYPHTWVQTTFKSLWVSMYLRE